MGAVTALLYGQRNPCIAGMVRLDGSSNNAQAHPAL